MTTIWERYFLKETLRVLFLFLFGFYSLYVMIDYTSHTASFYHHHIPFHWTEVVLYYLCEFIKRLDVLLPFAILIATIRTLCQLNMHNELVALMTSGITLKRLLRPFLFVGLLGTILLYLNTEILLPQALKIQRRINDTRTANKAKILKNTVIQPVALEDGTTLLYHHFDTSQMVFLDAYWIKSADEIYRIKELAPYGDVPMGTYVDDLRRNSRGELVIVSSEKRHPFPEIQFNKEVLLDTITSTDEMSLSTLWKKLQNRNDVLSEKEAKNLSAFYRKIMLPWMSFLAVIAPIPFCIRFTRQLPVFFIYALSIFGLVFLYLVVDATVVLAERQVFSPWKAIVPPFALFFAIFIYRFAKVK